MEREHAQEDNALGPLDDIVVLDLSFYLPSRWAAMFLATLGAEVISVEIPRSSAHGTAAAVTRDDDVRWVLYQRNKKDIALDLKDPAGLEALHRLAAQADVVLTSFGHGTAQRLGIDYTALRRVNPEIVYCAISGFGADGPYADLYAHEPNYEALSGVAARNRCSRDDGPHLAGASVADHVGGSYNAVVGILAAVVHKLKTGQGQAIDIAIAAGTLPMFDVSLHAHLLGDQTPHAHDYPFSDPAYAIYRTSDGNHVAVSPLEQWSRFCSVIGRPDLGESNPRARSGDRSAMTEEADRISAELAKTFATKTRDEWASINEVENISITPVWNGWDEVLADPQMQHRGVFVELDYEPLGRITVVNNPIHMSQTAPGVRSLPRFGEHTDEVLSRLGYSGAEIDSLRKRQVID